MSNYAKIGGSYIYTFSIKNYKRINQKLIWISRYEENDFKNSPKSESKVENSKFKRFYRKYTLKN